VEPLSGSTLSVGARTGNKQNKKRREEKKREEKRREEKRKKETKKNNNRIFTYFISNKYSFYLE